MGQIDLLSPFDLDPLHRPNRAVTAPMTRNRAGPGSVPGALNASYYAQRSIYPPLRGRFLRFLPLFISALYGKRSCVTAVTAASDYG